MQKSKQKVNYPLPTRTLILAELQLPRCLNCIAHCRIWYIRVLYTFREGGGACLIIIMVHYYPRAPKLLYSKGVCSHSVFAWLFDVAALFIPHVIRGRCYCYVYLVVGKLVRHPRLFSSSQINCNQNSCSH